MSHPAVEVPAPALPGVDAAPGSRRFINRLGLLVGLGSLTMLFAAFTSAYIVRAGGGDWIAIELPGELWVSTAFILASSLSLEMGRRAFLSGRLATFRRLAALTALLGVGFLASQLASWEALNEAGIYLRSNPKSSFFFVLTGVHGAHLVVGVVALAVLFGFAAAGRLDPRRSDAPTLTAIYWHFVGGLWVYLLVVLFLLA